jgi:HPt (histidine-containing phosphotransfer) domain-containing protein
MWRQMRRPTTRFRRSATLRWSRMLTQSYGTTDVRDRNLLDALEDQFGPDKARRFLSMARLNIAQVAGCLPDCRDREAVAHALHDLVSAAGNIGLRDLSEQARELMCALRRDKGDVSNLVTAVLTSARAALSTIDTVYPAAADVQ